MEAYRFSDKKGALTSYTGDNLAFSWDPPQIYGLVDFPEGGRIFIDLTDCELETLTVGMPVSMSFRRKYQDPQRGFYGYYWKAVPVR
jgi:hydroxymethylglutaryl-CoA synthase